MRKKRILLIDDEPDVTAPYQEYLEATHKFEVRSENDARTALQTARDFQPDLIVLDLIMPEKEGNTLAAELRADPTLAEVPVIFLTGALKPEELGEQGRVLGFYPFLAKPVGPMELIEHIERVFRAGALA